MTIYRPRRLRIVAITALLLSCQATYADCPSPGDLVDARVLDAHRLNAASDDKTRLNVRLGDEVVVKVQNLANLLQREECSTAKKRIVLYLDGRPVAGAVSKSRLDPAEGEMIFLLARTEDSGEVWKHLLEKPELTLRRVAVSVGIEDRFAIESESFLALDVISDTLAFWLLAAFIVLVAIFFVLALKTGLLRDPTSPVSATSQKAWSLSRVQAAWWFFIILLSYGFIGIVTCDFSTTITGTTLVLLGIASGTTLMSAVVDKSKDTPSHQVIADAAKVRVDQEIQTLQAAAVAAPLDQSSQQVLDAKKSQLQKLRGCNEQFFIDILSDANGISFHRFQIAVWTFVLGLVFAWLVYRDLAMPQFSETLLGLMGLSAGTFVAMKGTEADTPKP